MYNAYSVVRIGREVEVRQGGGSGEQGAGEAQKVDEGRLLGCFSLKMIILSSNVSRPVGWWPQWGLSDPFMGTA